MLCTLVYTAWNNCNYHMDHIISILSCTGCFIPNNPIFKIFQIRGRILKIFQIRGPILKIFWTRGSILNIFHRINVEKARTCQYPIHSIQHRFEYTSERSAGLHERVRVRACAQTFLLMFTDNYDTKLMSIWIDNFTNTFIQPKNTILVSIFILFSLLTNSSVNNVC